jgi:putative endonuclease
MTDPRKRFGDRGEDLATDYLVKKGMKILARQYKTKFAEIDLIAKDGDEIVFVEVKTRRSLAFGYPEESVTPVKLRKIQQAAAQYLAENKMNHTPHRVDIIAIHWTDEDQEVHHIIGAGG